MDLKVSVALGEGIGYLKNTHHHAELGIAYKNHAYDHFVDHFIAFYQQHKPSL